MTELFDHSNADVYVSGHVQMAFDRGMQIVEDDESLCLVPTPYSKVFFGVLVGLALLLTLLGLVLLGMYDLLNLSGLVALAMAVSLFYMLPYLYYSLHRKQMMLGPFLIVEKHGGRLILPRDGSHYEADEVARVQVVYGYRKRDPRPAACELSFLIHESGELIRKPIVLGGRYPGTIRDVVERIIALTDMDAHYYEHSRLTKYSTPSIRFTDLRDNG